MSIKQNAYNLTMRQNRELYGKIELLNFNMMTMAEISGLIIDGNINLDSDSDIRRTCELTMSVKKEITQVSHLINNYIRIFIGLKDIRTNDINWFNQGIYLVSNASIVYSATDNNISISGADLMARLTGLRDGVIGVTETLIPQGSITRNVIIETLKLGNINQYIIDIKESESILPIELKFDIDATIYDILSAIRDVYPLYQIYFDINGVFHFERIPSGRNEVKLITDEVWDKLLISYNDSIDFETIKNSLEIYGKTYDPQHFGKVTISNDTYIVNIPSVGEIVDYLIFGVEFSDVSNGINKMKLNNSLEYPLEKMLPITKDDYFVVQYLNNKFTVIGNRQIKTTIQETNLESPFNIEKIGEIKQILTDGDYSIIPNTKLAQERAVYELYHKTKVKDSITLTNVPIYYLDVYNLIEFHDKEYLIKSIETDLSYDGSQTITAYRYYPEYPTDII